MARRNADAPDLPWSAQKLDALLADEDVSVSVLSVAGPCLRPDGTWNRKQALDLAKLRFRRSEPAILLVRLVERFFETDGARYLNPDGAR